MAGASDYMVGNAPQGASYAAPLVGFQLGKVLSDLPDQYMKGRENRRQMAVEDAFQNGIPTLPDGSPDVNAITNTMARVGGGNYVQQLMPYLLNMRQGQQLSQGLSSIDASINGGPPGANTGPGTSSNATSPANLRAAPQSAGGLPRAPQAPQGPQGQPGQPPRQQATVMSIVAAQGFPNDQIGAVSASLARQLGVGPNDPIDTSDPQVRNVLGPAIAQFKRMGIGQVVQPGQAPGAPQAPRAPQISDADALRMRALQMAITRIRSAAAGMATVNPASAQALENQAAGYEKELQGIRDRINKNAEITPEEKNARDPAVQESKIAEEWGRKDVERYSKEATGIESLASGADRMIPHLQLARSLMNQPGFYSGTGEGVNLWYKRALAAFGGDPNAALPQEAFRKIMAANVLDQVNQMKDEAAASGGAGRIFQSQIELMEKAAQNPDNSIAANRLLTEIGFRAAQRSKQIADMLAAYKGGHPDSQFNKMLRDWEEAHPLFTQKELQHPEWIAAPTFNTPQEMHASGLPRGEVFKTADGVYKRVP